MKSETRLLIVHKCASNKLYVAVVLRGPQRVEFIEYSDNLPTLAHTVKKSRYYEELRLVYPSEYTNYFNELEGISEKELSEYMRSCSSCLDEFLSSICESIVQ